MTFRTIISTLSSSIITKINAKIHEKPTPAFLFLAQNITEDGMIFRVYPRQCGDFSINFMQREDYDDIEPILGRIKFIKNQNTVKLGGKEVRGAQMIYEDLAIDEMLFEHGCIRPTEIFANAAGHIEVFDASNRSSPRLVITNKKPWINLGSAQYIVLDGEFDVRGPDEFTMSYQKKIPDLLNQTFEAPDSLGIPQRIATRVYVLIRLNGTHTDRTYLDKLITHVSLVDKRRSEYRFSKITLVYSQSENTITITMFRSGLEHRSETYSNQDAKNPLEMDAVNQIMFYVPEDTRISEVYFNGILYDNLGYNGYGSPEKIVIDCNACDVYSVKFF
uniref:Galectin n=1 Tax=Romanomermis culicivorax TaxID=13658 RepID=A0A915HLP9_ROMCU